MSLLRTSRPSKLSALLLARYLHVLLTCYPGFQGVQWRVVWRHVTMVAKFLDLSITSWDRRPFALLDDGRKVLATVLFLSAILYEKVINVIFFLVLLNFLPYLQEQGFLRSRNFTAMATRRNDSFSLYSESNAWQPTIRPKIKILDASWIFILSRSVS